MGKSKHYGSAECLFTYFNLFQKGREREKEMEISIRIGCLHAPTQACALTGNQTVTSRVIGQHSTTEPRQPGKQCSVHGKLGTTEYFPLNVRQLHSSNPTLHPFSARSSQSSLCSFPRKLRNDQKKDLKPRVLMTSIKFSSKSYIYKSYLSLFPLPQPHLYPG